MMSHRACDRLHAAVVSLTSGSGHNHDTAGCILICHMTARREAANMISKGRACDGLQAAVDHSLNSSVIIMIPPGVCDHMVHDRPPEVITTNSLTACHGAALRMHARRKRCNMRTLNPTCPT